MLPGRALFSEEDSVFKAVLLLLLLTKYDICNDSLAQYISFQRPLKFNFQTFDVYRVFIRKKEDTLIERTVRLKCSNCSFGLTISPRDLYRSVTCIDDNERSRLLDSGEGRKKKWAGNTTRVFFFPSQFPTISTIWTPAWTGHIARRCYSRSKLTINAFLVPQGFTRWTHSVPSVSGPSWGWYHDVT